MLDFSCCFHQCVRIRFVWTKDGFLLPAIPPPRSRAAASLRAGDMQDMEKDVKDKAEESRKAEERILGLMKARSGVSW